VVKKRRKRPRRLGLGAGAATTLGPLSRLEEQEEREE
jgi:hypothetical protein